MINRVELLGNLTHDPELRYTARGFPYCFIELATNRYAGGEQHTDFHSVTAWHNQAERSARELHVGDRVFVEARLETNALTRDDGTRENRVRVVAIRIMYLHGRRQTPIITEPTGPEHIADVIAEGKESSVEARTPVEEGA
jgi:single-strand DNA-binding protein